MKPGCDRVGLTTTGNNSWSTDPQSSVRHLHGCCTKFSNSAPHVGLSGSSSSLRGFALKKPSPVAPTEQKAELVQDLWPWGKLNPIGQSLVVFEIFCWPAGFRTLKICKKRWRIPGAKVVAAFWKKRNSSGKSWNLSISQWPLGLLRKVSTVSPAVISFPLYKVCRCLGSASKIFPVHQTIKEVGLGKMDGSYIPTWAPLRRR